MGAEWACSLQCTIDGVGLLEESTCRKLACLLAREAEAVERGSQILLQYGGPREWDVPPSGWLLTSRFSLCVFSLCFRVPRMSWGYEGLEAEWVM